MKNRQNQGFVRQRWRTLALAICGLTTLLIWSVIPSSAETITAQINIVGGTLNFVAAPHSVSLSGELNGFDQNISQSSSVDIGDATGSGAGWSLSYSSTIFTAGNQSLPSDAISVQNEPNNQCDPGSSCIIATNTVAYPYILPADVATPTPTELFNAAPGSGIGNQTVDIAFTATLPASTLAGSYISIWTVSLAAGP